MYLLLAFILVPIIEIGVFIEVGGLIGLWPTIAIVLLTAFAGTALLRAQGFAVLHRAQAQLARGELPMGAVFDGVCLLVAGALLLTPGFVTDALGLLLFFPPFRQRLGRFVLDRLMRSGKVRVYADGAGFRPHGPQPRPPHGQGDVLEGEWQEVDPGRADPDGGPGDTPDGAIEPPKDSKWRPPHSRPGP